MSTLSGRIEWIRARLGAPGKPISNRELARRANLSEPSITMLLRRQPKSAKNSARPETLIKIAKAGGVAPLWLATGEGPRELADPTFGDFMKTLWQAPDLQKACAAHPDRWHLSTVARALSIPHRGGAPDAGWERFLDDLQGGHFDDISEQEAEQLATSIEQSLAPIPIAPAKRTRR